MNSAENPGVTPRAVLRAAVVLAGVLEPDPATPADVDVIALARTMLNAASDELDWEGGFLNRIAATTAR